MGVSVCTHGYESYWACAECMYGDEVSPPEVAVPAPKVAARFVAVYDGHCDACDQPILMGQDIVRMDDDQYLHEGCE